MNAAPAVTAATRASDESVRKMDVAPEKPCGRPSHTVSNTACCASSSVRWNWLNTSAANASVPAATTTASAGRITRRTHAMDTPSRVDTDEQDGGEESGRLPTANCQL